MNKVGRSSTEDTANFVASCIKGHLQGVHITSLSGIYESSFSAISEDREYNGCDDATLRDK